MTSDDQSCDRAIGAMLGLAIGDAIGTTLEFSVRDARQPVTDMVGGDPFRLKPGEWTDDTAMALCPTDLPAITWISAILCSGFAGGGKAGRTPAREAVLISEIPRVRPSFASSVQAITLRAARIRKARAMAR